MSVLTTGAKDAGSCYSVEGAAATLQWNNNLLSTGEDGDGPQALVALMVNQRGRNYDRKSVSAAPPLSHLSFDDGLQFLYFLLELGVLRIHLGQQLVELINILNVFPGRSAPLDACHSVVCDL